METDIILDVFGDSPRIRVMAVLLTGRDVAQPVEYIAEYTDLDANAVNDHLSDLETWAVAEETEDGWRMPRDEDVARKLAEVEWSIINRIAYLDEMGRLEEVTG